MCVELAKKTQLVIKNLTYLVLFELHFGAKEECLAQRIAQPQGIKL